ncbi:MAG TPA: CPBP family intramembrane glutamic endopeptidase [Vicinamibacterales bacterium]|jgi:membrane protease YdiL (CAAX protease family)|nr:CPBP family intramembrane glutamic endopeptidase [Vicinamibacterales bacterium]
MLPDVDPEPQNSSPQPRVPVLARVVALLEVVICSDFLSQVALGGTLSVFGYQPYIQGRLSVVYVVGLSLADSILLIALVLILLYAHGERPREVLFGSRPIVGEAAAGLPMILVALAIAIAVLVAVQRFAPSLHTVPHNPLQELLRSPRDASLFALVVLVAGGVREEIQRAFLLHRFEQFLGGGTTGVIVTSVAFGAGHLLQGVDAAVATGLLGAFWGVIYLRRRSCAAPIVSHSGFDLVQILQFLLAGRS